MEEYFLLHVNYTHFHVIKDSYLLNEHNYFNYLNYTHAKMYEYILFYNNKDHVYK